MASPPPTRWAPRYCCRRNIWIPIVFHPCANVGNGILHTDPNTKVIQTAILLPVCGWVMWHDRVLFFTRSQHPTGDAMTPRPASTSTAEVVRQAVALLDAEGPDAFSMRKLGAAMGVDPMTVYHHVPNKAALFDLVVDELWSGLAPAVDGGWQQQVASLAHELRRVLLEHPRLVQLVGARPMVAPGYLDWPTSSWLGWTARDCRPHRRCGCWTAWWPSPSARSRRRCANPSVVTASPPNRPWPQ